MLVTQSCPTLCNPMDCSPPGSSVYEILQARILKWVAISSSKTEYQIGIKNHIFGGTIMLKSFELQPNGFDFWPKLDFPLSPQNESNHSEADP